MSEQYIGEIRLFAFDRVPPGWTPCNGQLLAIAGNQALFSLIGTTYGGNGQTNFALPDLRGRVPVHFNATIERGAAGGEEAHALTTAEMPAHAHAVNAGSGATAASPAGAVWGSVDNLNMYSQVAATTLDPSAIGSSGQGQPHPNMQPSLVLNYYIAVQGIFPVRD